MSDIDMLAATLRDPLTIVVPSIPSVEWVLRFKMKQELALAALESMVAEARRAQEERAEWEFRAAQAHEFCGHPKVSALRSRLDLAIEALREICALDRPYSTEATVQPRASVIASSALESVAAEIEEKT